MYENRKEAGKLLAKRIEQLQNECKKHGYEEFKNIKTLKDLGFDSPPKTKEELLETLKKRPFTKSDVENLFSENTQRIFNDLLKENMIEKVKVGGVTFYRSLL